MNEYECDSCGDLVPDGDGFLGATKREAWIALRSILRTFEAVRSAKK